MVFNIPTGPVVGEVRKASQVKSHAYAGDAESNSYDTSKGSPDRNNMKMRRPNMTDGCVYIKRALIELLCLLFRISRSP